MESRMLLLTALTAEAQATVATITSTTELTLAVHLVKQQVDVMFL